MTVQEIVDELTEHGFEDTSETQKLKMINDTLWDIESREPWPFLEKTATLDFDGASASPTNLPGNFKQVLWIYDNTNAVTIWPERVQTVRDRHGNQIAQVGDPSTYYFVGSSLRFYPVPGASAGRFQLDYIATQPKVVITSAEVDILLPPRHHRAIVLGALWRLYKMEDDPENGSIFQVDYENKLVQMHEDLFRRQFQRADQIFVIDEDDEYLF